MGKNSLLEILLDSTTSDAEKDDAIIELGINFPDEDTVDVLIKISSEVSCDEMIAASCGESIAHIWLNNNQIDYEKLSKLTGVALNEALSLIKAQRPDWHKAYSDMHQIK